MILMLYMICSLHCFAGSNIFVLGWLLQILASTWLHLSWSCFVGYWFILLVSDTYAHACSILRIVSPYCTSSCTWNCVCISLMYTYFSMSCLVWFLPLLYVYICTCWRNGLFGWLYECALSCYCVNLNWLVCMVASCALLVVHQDMYMLIWLYLNFEWPKLCLVMSCWSCYYWGSCFSCIVVFTRCTAFTDFACIVVFTKLKVLPRAWSGHSAHVYMYIHICMLPCLSRCDFSYLCACFC